jgi:hypothetical protein
MSQRLRAHLPGFANEGQDQKDRLSRIEPDDDDRCRSQ